jgi:predicted N-acetyltransferase YhbS
MSPSFESDVVGPPPPMVREETPQDRDSIALLLRTAFGRDTENQVVDELRDAPGAGAVGLVAVRSERRPGADMSAIGTGDVVGYLRLTPVPVDGDTVLMLAPLATATASQRRGVGTYLVQFALEMMGDAGYSAVVTPYDEPFLDRFGFGPPGEGALSMQGTDHQDTHRLRVAALRPSPPSGQIRLPEPLSVLVRPA